MFTDAVSLLSHCRLLAFPLLSSCFLTAVSHCDRSQLGNGHLGVLLSTEPFATIAGNAGALGTAGPHSCDETPDTQTQLRIYTSVTHSVTHSHTLRRSGRLTFSAAAAGRRASRRASLQSDRRAWAGGHGPGRPLADPQGQAVRLANPELLARSDAPPYLSNLVLRHPRLGTVSDRERIVVELRGSEVRRSEVRPWLCAGSNAMWRMYPSTEEGSLGSKLVGDRVALGGLTIRLGEQRPLEDHPHMLASCVATTPRTGCAPTTRTLCEKVHITLRSTAEALLAST